MKTKIQIKSISGELIFEYECKDNTIKKTVIEAVKRNTNLSNADLSNTNLSNADLYNAKLSNADLSNAKLYNAKLYNAKLYNAKLSNADLRNADLRNAKLYNAKLSNADLSSANLRSADLRNADLYSAIKVPIYCKWPIGITGGKIHIGCEKRTIKEWDSFFDSDEIISTPRETHEFKQIQACYEAYKGYYITLNKTT